jgi:hypothetical protein
LPISHPLSQSYYQIWVARDVSETEQVTGQKLYDILSKYLDCLKNIDKINDEQSLVFKNQLEEFKDK